MFKSIFTNISEKKPLVHSITNYVTVNDCANIILAAGGSPIMADDIREVEDITSICSALVINMGTLNERTIESMVLAGKKANANGSPVIFDPVGVGASTLRNETAFRLLNEVKFSVIRGNISEILFLAKGAGTTKGVDASEADKVTPDNIQSVIDFAKSLSKKTGAVIAISGAIDIVANAEKAYTVTNGHPIMAQITGSGCMLAALIGTFCAANSDTLLDATTAAVGSMGLCGELAQEKMSKNDGGTGMFRMYLIDYISKLDAEKFESGAKIAAK